MEISYNSDIEVVDLGNVRYIAAKKKVNGMWGIFYYPFNSVFVTGYDVSQEKILWYFTIYPSDGDIPSHTIYTGIDDVSDYENKSESELQDIASTKFEMFIKKLLSNS